MKAITKNLLPEEKIRELVKIHFGEDRKVTSVRELTGGFFAAVYLIGVTGEPDQMVLKVGVIPGTPLLTYERDVMPTEVACLTMLREKTTVPVPKIYACDFSKTHIKSNYFFMEVMEGSVLSEVSRKLSDKDTAQIRRELAYILTQMHSVKGPYFGYFTEEKEKQFATWKEAFYQMVGMVLEDGRRLKKKIPYDRIEHALQAHGDCLETPKVPALVDFDCHEGNIFVKQGADGWHISGIVDLERALWGDPIGDFPTAFIFCDDIRKEKVLLETYLEKSDEIRAYTGTEVRKFLLYRMYVLTIMIAETFRFGGSVYGKLQEVFARKNLKKTLKELEKLEG